MIAVNSTFGNRIFQFLAVAGNRLTATGLQFATLLAAGNFFGAAEVGAIGASQAAVLLIGTLCGGGAPLFILRRVPRTGFPKWFHFIHVWIAGCSALTMLLCLLYTLSDIRNLSQGDLGAFRGSSIFPPLVLGVGAMCYGLSKIYLEVLKARGQPGLALFLEFGLPYCFVLAVMPLAQIGIAPIDQMGILLFCAFPSSFIVLSAGLMMRVGRPHLSSMAHPPNHRRLARKSWRELLSLLSVQLCNTAMFSLPVLLASSSLGLREAGILTVILKVVGTSATVSGVVSAYFARRATFTFRDGNTKDKRRLALDMALTNSIATSFVLVPVLAAPAFVLNLFGEETSVSSAVSALVALAFLRLLRSLFGMPETLLALSGKSGYDIVAFVVALATFALSIWATGIHLHGIVWASGLSTLVRGGTSSFFAARLLVMDRNSNPMQIGENSK